MWLLFAVTGLAQATAITLKGQGFAQFGKEKQGLYFSAKPFTIALVAAEAMHYGYDEVSDRMLSEGDGSKQTSGKYAYDARCGFFLAPSLFPVNRGLQGAEESIAGARRVKRSISYGYDDFVMSFYSYDGLGSVRGLTDAIGTSLGNYHYDAYGLLIENTVSVANPYQFAGERYDSDLGLYYLRARYLDVETGRFHTLDSWEGSQKNAITLHKYLYANANPVMNVDPSGNFSLSEATAVIKQLTGLVNIAFRLVNLYDTITSVLDLIVGVRSLFKYIGGEISMNDWKTFVPDKSKYDLSYAASAFLSMAGQALTIGSPGWIAGYMAGKKKIKAYLIYMPTFVPLPVVPISTGLKLGGKPVKLISGANAKGLGSLVGVGIRAGNFNNQLMRMDIGDKPKGHGGKKGLKGEEIKVLEEANFHMHVYLWGHRN